VEVLIVIAVGAAALVATFGAAEWRRQRAHRLLEFLADDGLEAVELTTVTRAVRVSSEFTPSYARDRSLFSDLSDEDTASFTSARVALPPGWRDIAVAVDSAAFAERPDLVSIPNPRELGPLFCVGPAVLVEAIRSDRALQNTLHGFLRGDGYRHIRDGDVCAEAQVLDPMGINALANEVADVVHALQHATPVTVEEASAPDDIVGT